MHFVAFLAFHFSFLALRWVHFYFTVHNREYCVHAPTHGTSRGRASCYIEVSNDSGLG